MTAAAAGGTNWVKPGDVSQRPFGFSRIGHRLRVTQTKDRLTAGIDRIEQLLSFFDGAQ